MLIALVAALATRPRSRRAWRPRRTRTESATELAKKTQNPVADLISVPFQNNFNFNTGEKDATVYILNVQPVIPIKLSDDWNLITRTIIPIINQPSLYPGAGYDLGERIRPGRHQPHALPVAGQARQVHLGAWARPSRYRRPPTASWAIGSSPWGRPASR